MDGFRMLSRRSGVRDLALTAFLCAIVAAVRVIFFLLPQIKPVMALTILIGAAFGGETGFLVGSGSMLLSNMLLSQGPWTVVQMLAMGVTGFLAGFLTSRGLLSSSRRSLSSFGALCALVIYGGIVNTACALLWAWETLNFRLLLGCYAAAFPADALHAASTALFLWFGAEPLLRSLNRLKAPARRP